MISIEVAGIDIDKGGWIESPAADQVALRFLDADDYEGFFGCHAYFRGPNDPDKALKTTPS